MIILLVLIAVLTTIYLIFFCRKLINFVYIIKESKNESKMYEKYGTFKFLSYLIYLIFLIITVLIAKNISLSAWVIVYYIYWAIGIMFIKLNLKMLSHYLDVLFVSKAVKEIEKEFIIGGIVKRGSGYCFLYRLTGDTVKI